MLRSERLLQNGQGPVIELLGFSPLSQVKVKKGEVIETGGQVGMPGSQALFLDGQGSLIQWLCFPMTPLILAKDCQGVETRGDVGMFRTSGFFPNGQSSATEGLHSIHKEHRYGDHTRVSGFAVT